MARSDDVMNYRNRVKLALIAYKGGKCERCGYCKPVPPAYDFHHLDPTKKKFAISGKSYSFERLKEEVDKCILLCRICHAEVHWEETKDRREKRLKKHRKVRKYTLKEIECGICNKLFIPVDIKVKYCSYNCSGIARRKVERPSKDQLIDDLKTMSMVRVGKKYGVSDAAVRKWLNKYFNEEIDN